MAMLQQSSRLTLQGAQVALQAAQRRAVEIGVPMDIAVVDDGGHLLAFMRMDGAKLGSVAIAINKAHSAAIRRQATGPAVVEGQADLLLSLALAIGSHAEQTPIRGGLLLVIAGNVVGAIGVSSGSQDQDTEVALAGVEAFGAACHAEGTEQRGSQAT